MPGTGSSRAGSEPPRCRSSRKMSTTCTSGGSTHVLHLHGELTKARSTVDPSLVYEIDGWEIKEGDLCEKGSQLRPHIVWFGEMVDAIPAAEQIASAADAIIVVGTSLQVYPAAGLAWCAPKTARHILIDPNPPIVPKFDVIKAGASEGWPRPASYWACRFPDNISRFRNLQRCLQEKRQRWTGYCPCQLGRCWRKLPSSFVKSSILIDIVMFILHLARLVLDGNPFR